MSRYLIIEWTAAVRSYSPVRKPITLEEQPELFAAIQRGSPAARRRALNDVVRRTILFVATIGKRYVTCGVLPEDILSAGCKGLIRAADTFDPTMGLKFLSYAVHWIRQAIGAHINQHARLIRLPRPQIEAVQKAAKARSIGAPVAIADLDRLEAAEQMDHMVHLDAPRGENGDTWDIADPEAHTEEAMIADARARAVRRAISRAGLLDERQRDMLADRFGLNSSETMQTYAQIGERYGMSRMNVQQHLQRAIQRLKKSPEARQALYEFYSL